MNTVPLILSGLVLLCLAVDLGYFAAKRRFLLSGKVFALAVIAAVVLMLAGCKYQVTRYGPTKTEEATVVDLAYVPSGHGSGSGVGISMSGDISVSSTSVHIPERYAVVFKCDHGKFVVEGSQHAALWKRLSKDQPVTIQYREVQECTKDGDSVYGCVTTDLDFIDARPSQVRPGTPANFRVE
jgi:hypothetical protein